MIEFIEYDLFSIDDIPLKREGCNNECFRLRPSHVCNYHVNMFQCCHSIIKEGDRNYDIKCLKRIVLEAPAVFCTIYVAVFRLNYDNLMSWDKQELQYFTNSVAVSIAFLKIYFWSLIIVLLCNYLLFIYKKFYLKSKKFRSLDFKDYIFTKPEDYAYCSCKQESSSDISSCSEE